MNTQTPEAVETPENETVEETERTGFAAGPYIKRTREVLKTQMHEAGKVRAETRKALLDVWRDLQTDLRDRLGAAQKSAKRQTERLWQRLPFVGAKAKPSEAATPSEAHGEAEPASQPSA